MFMKKSESSIFRKSHCLFLPPKEIYAYKYRHGKKGHSRYTKMVTINIKILILPGGKITSYFLPFADLIFQNFL